MSIPHEHITEIIKFNENGQEVWFYSTESQNSDNKYQYYMLYIKDNCPVILELDNAINKLQEFKSNPIDINKNSVEFIKFLAIKDYAEKYIQQKKMK